MTNNVKTTASAELLNTALQLAEGAAIFFVVTPSGKECFQLKEKLRRTLSGRPVIEVEVTPDKPLDLGGLRKQLESLKKESKFPIIFIDTQGLEVADLEVAIQGALAKRIKKARKILQDLNLKREALAELEIPIVFWVTPSVLRAFSIWAADLFSANSGVFHYYEIPQVEQWGMTIERSYEVFPAESLDLWKLPETEIKGRVRLYEDQINQEARKRHPHFPYLAALHMELARLYRHIGEYLRALEHLQKAGRLYRKLTQENPDRFLPDLAGSLNNLGVILSELGRYAEALEATEEAVAIRRQLAKRQPERFLPDLAMSLSNLGGILYELGQREKALETTEEAVEIYRELAEKNPDRFLPDLARSLGSHGLALLLSLIHI